jgi:hypothetical protein
MDDPARTALCIPTDAGCQGRRRQLVNSLRHYSVTALAVVGLGIAAIPAWADDVWTSTFTITNFYVAQQNNYQYRVYGMPTVASCTSATNWAYVNDADAGSPGTIAAILSAYYTGKLISLHVITVNGYCHIIELMISG